MSSPCTHQATQNANLLQRIQCSHLQYAQSYLKGTYQRFDIIVPPFCHFAFEDLRGVVSKVHSESVSRSQMTHQLQSRRNRILPLAADNSPSQIPSKWPAIDQEEVGCSCERCIFNNSQCQERRRECALIVCPVASIIRPARGDVRNGIRRLLNCYRFNADWSKVPEGARARGMTSWISKCSLQRHQTHLVALVGAAERCSIRARSIQKPPKLTRSREVLQGVNSIRSQVFQRRYARERTNSVQPCSGS